MPRLRFSVLGPLSATFDGVPLVLGGAKQQMVLALLLLEANRVVPSDRLVDWVWSDDAGERSSGTLQVYMSNLRRLFAPATEVAGRPLIATQRPGYVIHVDADQLDLTLFEELRREGEAALREGRHADAVGPLRRAGAVVGRRPGGAPHRSGRQRWRSPGSRWRGCR